MIGFIFYVGGIHTVNIYLLKVKNKNTKKRGEICSKLTVDKKQD